MNKRARFTINLNNNYVFFGVFILLVLFRIWLIAGIPKMPIYGPHDDLFFSKAAHYIIHGQWMVPYSQMTLIKGPFYAFFLIFSGLTGLPLFLNETIFYIVACIVLFFAFIPLINSKWWRLLLFTVLLFCPASLATNMNLRVYREFVYFTLTLFVVAFSIGLFLRINKKISTMVFWSIGLGVSMGAFMITREEGVWIYPILFLLLLICIFLIWKKKLDQKWWRSAIILFPILLWYIPIIIISSLNYSHYGFWGITEQLEPDFNRVMNTLARIKTSTWYPFIPITEEARMKAYKASPILNELSDSIESSVPSWNIHDDSAMNSKPAWYLSQYGNGGKELGVHFLWLFRDVMYVNGYYSQGKYPDEFYKELANQLENDCNIGKLICSQPRIIPFIGAIDKRDYPIISRLFFEDSYSLLNLDYIGIASLDFKTWYVWPENDDAYKYFEEFIYNSLRSPGIPSVEDSTFSLIDGKTDLRIKILTVKENFMRVITQFYKALTLIYFIVGLVVWLLLFFLSIFKKHLDIHLSFLIISLFVLGLYVSRLMTLDIMTATTSISGIMYSPSIYIFIYIFPFLTLYWLFKKKSKNEIHKDVNN